MAQISGEDVVQASENVVASEVSAPQVSWAEWTATSLPPLLLSYFVKFWVALVVFSAAKELVLWAKEAISLRWFDRSGTAAYRPSENIPEVPDAGDVTSGNSEKRQCEGRKTLRWRQLERQSGSSSQEEPFAISGTTQVPGTASNREQRADRRPRFEATSNAAFPSNDEELFVISGTTDIPKTAPDCELKVNQERADDSNVGDEMRQSRPASSEDFEIHKAEGLRQRPTRTFQDENAEKWEKLAKSKQGEKGSNASKHRALTNIEQRIAAEGINKMEPGNYSSADVYYPGQIASLRAQQDAEYEESLRQDRLREAERVKKEKLKTEAQERLGGEVPDTEDHKVLKICLPSGLSLRRRFRTSDSASQICDFVTAEIGLNSADFRLLFLRSHHEQIDLLEESLRQLSISQKLPTLDDFGFKKMDTVRVELL
mmetsp:Transcript_2306/g.6907  ORF Transcript_2306/g.6907 Transcript_2306/m.6907 type:complete len:429 (-) Transcript_2306:70-1356(-)